MHAETPITTLIHGDARGVDRICGQWAKENAVAVEEYPAQWELHGNAAGPIRNTYMLTQNPDLLVAFPGGKGTANMVRQAGKAGLKIITIMPRLTWNTDSQMR
jgi:hypothetical protein